VDCINAAKTDGEIITAKIVKIKRVRSAAAGCDKGLEIAECRSVEGAARIGRVLVEIKNERRGRCRRIKPHSVDAVAAVKCRSRAESIEIVVAASPVQDIGPCTGIEMVVAAAAVQNVVACSAG